MARERKVTIRLTDEQFEELERRRGDKTRAEFLYLILLDYLDRRQELEKELQRIRAERKECRKLHAELGKIGGNLNQLARALNRKKMPAKEKKALLSLIIETLSLVQELKERLVEGHLGNPEADS